MFCNLVNPYTNDEIELSRNPCFIRLCFAIKYDPALDKLNYVAILVLLDYVLQYQVCSQITTVKNVAILVLLDYVLQLNTNACPTMLTHVAILVLLDYVLQLLPNSLLSLMRMSQSLFY